MVVDAATPDLKPEHVCSDDDDDDDVDTPVIGRSPAHAMSRRGFSHRGFSDVARLHRSNSYAGSVEDILGAAAAIPCAQRQRHHQLRRTLAVADWLARVNVNDDDCDDGSGSSSEVEVDSLCDAGMKTDTPLDEHCVSRWSSADHGFISGLMTESAELDASRLALTATNQTSSIFPADDIDDDEGACLPHQLDASMKEPLLMLDEFRGPCVRRRHMSSAGSMDDARRRWRSQRRYSLSHSMASSAASSEYEYRESLISKGFSVDLGEDLEGMMTPPTAKRSAGVTVAGMESLHHALKQIQRDVDEMNRKFDGLRSSTAVGTEPGPAWSLADKSPADRSMQFEPSEQGDEDVSSERQQSDYIWDYRSDLVPEGAGHQFIALRPIVPSPSGNFVLHRANLPRDYSDLCTEASTGCGRSDDGMVDLYIDDDFIGTDAAVRERLPEKFDMESRSSSEGLPKSKPEVALSWGSVPTNCHNHSTQVCGCNSDTYCCFCCSHSTSCGHSDSCATARLHCASRCDVSAPQTRRSSASNHPCCRHHFQHVHHTKPAAHSSRCCVHGDSHAHCCSSSTSRLSLRHTHREDCDCCRHSPAPARTSTPADEIPPLDHCNNFHSSPSGTGSIVHRRPVGPKQDVSKLIDRTCSGCTAVQQVCVYY